jgi:hypothetical protein
MTTIAFPEPAGAVRINDWEVIGIGADGTPDVAQLFECGTKVGP